MGNRDDLLAGARRCLVEKGYAASTVRDIAGAAGVSMAAIGYHFGSREELLTRALNEMMDEWGRAVATSWGPGGYRDTWARMIGSFPADRALFLASVEAAVLAEHADGLRARLADSLAQARSGSAAAALGADEAGLDPATVRAVGSVHLALISGVLLQHLTDPDRAPDADEVVAGIRALAGLVPVDGAPPDAGDAGPASGADPDR